MTHALVCDRQGLEGRLERGESGITVEALAAILAALGVSLWEFFKAFKQVLKPRPPRRR